MENVNKTLCLIINIFLLFFLIQWCVCWLFWLYMDIFDSLIKKLLFTWPVAHYLIIIFSWVLVIWRVDAITRHRIRECPENFQMVQRVNLFAIYIRIQLCWIISEISDFSQTNSFAELLKKWKLVIIGAIYGLKSLIFEI